MAAMRETWRDILRSGDWLTRERVRLVALAILAASIIGAGLLIATSNGLNDRFGRPLGTDFSNVYAAGTYVLDGEAAAPFSPPRQFAREQAIFGAKTQFYGWHYPPYFLGLAALFAAMPYPLALVLWQGVTLLLYLLVIRGILLIPPLKGEGVRSERQLAFASSEEQPAHRAGLWQRAETGGVTPPQNEAPPPGSLHSPPSLTSGGGIESLWLLLALAYPAVFINLGHGHNGFLTAALIGAALLQLDRRPWLAGVLIGLLVYKPQFGPLIPLVLAASGRWRSFAAATLTVVALTLIVTLAFGPEIWTAFLASTKFTRTVVLEQGDTGWEKIQSVFSVVRMWGGSIPLAYALQTTVTIAVAAALAWLWRSRASFAFKAAALAIGTILATPYCLDYDLMVVAPAIAFLVRDGMEHGFSPWEKTILAALWFVPLIARTVAGATLVPLAVPTLLIAFAFMLHRAIEETGALRQWRFAADSLK
jgi:alpha-1,2-mannosyltransferase